MVFWCEPIAFKWQCFHWFSIMIWYTRMKNYFLVKSIEKCSKHTILHILYIWIILDFIYLFIYMYLFRYLFIYINYLFKNSTNHPKTPGEKKSSVWYNLALQCFQFIYNNEGILTITSALRTKSTTEWFKIHLTLFRCYVSHKWENIMYLFKAIYKLWCLGSMWWKCCEILRTKMAVFFHRNSQKKFTRTEVYGGIFEVFCYTTVSSKTAMHTAQSIIKNVSAW